MNLPSLERELGHFVLLVAVVTEPLQERLVAVQEAEQQAWVWVLASVSPWLYFLGLAIT